MTSGYQPKPINLSLSTSGEPVSADLSPSSPGSHCQVGSSGHDPSRREQCLRSSTCQVKRPSFSGSFRTADGGERKQTSDSSTDPNDIRSFSRPPQRRPFRFQGTNHQPDLSNTQTLQAIQQTGLDFINGSRVGCTMAEINLPASAHAALNTTQLPKTGEYQFAELVQLVSIPFGLGSHTLTHPSVSLCRKHLSQTDEKGLNAIPECYQSESKLSDYQIKREPCVASLLSSWDCFVPAATSAWVFPATGQRGQDSGSSTITQTLSAARQPTLRLRLQPPPPRQSASFAAPDWREFHYLLNSTLETLVQQLPEDTNGQENLSGLYWDLYQFSLLRSSGDISQEDVDQLQGFIKRSNSIRQNSTAMELAEALSNLSSLLRGIVLSRKCHKLLTTVSTDQTTGQRCHELLAKINQLDSNNQGLQRWRSALTTMQTKLQSRHLSNSMSALSLTQRPDVPAPSSAPQGAVGGADISERPPREALIDKAEKLRKERHLVMISITEVDPATEDGAIEHDELQEKLQRLDQELTEIIQTYQLDYGHEMLARMNRWQVATEVALASEGSATIQGLEELQGQITSAIPEIELFFEKGTHQLCTSLWNQLTDALARTQSREDFVRVRGWVNSDSVIRPNQVRQGDDQPLYFLFQELSQELDNQICIFKINDLSDQEREQARTNIIKAKKRLDKIIDLFRRVIHRYERLKSGHQYPCQLAEMEEASRKAHRVMADAPSQKTRERLRLIKTLKNSSIDSNHLLDMSDEDFQLIFNLLGGKKLNEKNRKTMAKNSWQLTDNNNLVIQRGHERVTVVANGNMYQLIDTASSKIIGTLDRIRWERIHRRLEREGYKGANNITRQMVLDDYRNFPTTEEQWRAQEGISSLRDEIEVQGSEIVPNPADNERPEDLAAASEILRYQRQYFNKQ